MTQRKSSALIEFEQITGLSFIQIPAGTYTVGVQPEQSYLAIASEESSYSQSFIPPTSVTLPTFFISEDLMRLSHWRQLQASKFAAALNAEVTPKDIDLYRDNLVRDIRYGKDFGFKRCLKDVQEVDPALTLPFTRCEAIAQVLGMALPTWSQWEVAARGEQAYLFPWGNEWDLDQMQLSYLPYAYTWEDSESTMGLFRETERRNGSCCRVDAFGNYADAVSPFGLKGLLNWGVEWNRIDRALPNQPQKITDLKLIVRSLCDLGYSRTMWDLSDREEQNQVLRASQHRSFSGVPLPLFSQWPDNYRIGAFRLIYVASAATHDPTTMLAAPLIQPKQPDWELYDLLGCTREELIDYLGEPDATENMDFGSGSSTLIISHLFYYSRGIHVQSESQYSRITRPSPQETAFRVLLLEFSGNTIRQIETRHEFLAYDRPIYDEITIGTPRANMAESSWETDPGLQGIQITWGFDDDDRVSRAILTLNRQPRPTKADPPSTYQSIRCLHTLKAAHLREITAISVLSDGTRYVTVGNNLSIRIWDRRTGRVLHALTEETDYQICSVTISSDGQWIASSNRQQGLTIWQTATGQVVHSLRNLDESVSNILTITPSKKRFLITPDRQRFLHISQSCATEVWNMETGELQHTLTTQRAGSPEIIALSPDGQFVVGNSSDDQDEYSHRLMAWDVQTGQRVRVFATEFTAETVAFSPDGQFLAVGRSIASNIHILSFTSGDVVSTLKASPGAYSGFSEIASSPDGGYWVALSSFEVVVWDRLTQQVKHQFRPFETTSATSIAITPNNQLLVGSFNGDVYLFDLATGLKVQTLDSGHTNLIYALAIRDRLLVSGSGDGTVRVWDLEAGAEIACLRGHDGVVSAVTITPNGKTIVSASWDKTIKLWHLPSQTEICTLTRQTDWVSSISLSADGDFLASMNRDRTIKLWHLPSQTEICSHSEPNSTSQVKGSQAIAISPDGATIASLDVRGVSLRRANSGEFISSLNLERSFPCCVVFSPVDDQLAIGTMEGVIELFNWQSGEKIRAFKRHLAAVRSIAFSGDGTILVSASEDRTVKLWDVATGARLKTLEEHQDEVLTVAFSSDGQYIASAGSDKTIKIWRC